MRIEFVRKVFFPIRTNGSYLIENQKFAKHSVSLIKISTTFAVDNLVKLGDFVDLENIGTSQRVWRKKALNDFWIRMPISWSYKSKILCFLQL